MTLIDLLIGLTIGFGQLIIGLFLAMGSIYIGLRLLDKINQRHSKGNWNRHLKFLRGMS